MTQLAGDGKAAADLRLRALAVEHDGDAGAHDDDAHQHQNGGTEVFRHATLLRVRFGFAGASAIGESFRLWLHPAPEPLNGP